MNKFKNIVIFGGSGFIGAHLSINFLTNNLVDQIILADIEAPKYQNLPPQLKSFFDSGKIKFIKVDVRSEIVDSGLPSETDLIVNLAAVHREPGHLRHEYYNTNIAGAENISDWARKINCQYIVFTSSIAVYGTEKTGPKTEDTTPQPNTPYGISKLAAEKIHEDWVNESNDRKLLIVRPGVIFGTGEAGNITRMVRGIRGRYFAYLSNQNIIKSGGYVKELCSSIAWVMDWQLSNNASKVLYNFTMNPASTMKQYAEGIKKALNIPNRKIFNIPFGLLLPMAGGVELVANFLKINQPINRTRVRKLLRENNIIAQRLVDMGYRYHYSLDDALSDWLAEHPQDWGIK